MGGESGQGMDLEARSSLVCKECSFLEGRRSSARGSLDEENTWERSKQLGAENSLCFYRFAQWIHGE